MNIGYLQHGKGTIGPYRTESVRIKNEHSDKWLAFFEGRWRRVYVRINRIYIIYQGAKIDILIEGI